MANRYPQVRFFPILFLLTLLACPLTGQAAAVEREKGSHATGHVIVKFLDQAENVEISRALGRVSGTGGHKLTRAGIQKVHLPPGMDEGRAVELLNRDPAVEYAHLDWKVELLDLQIIPASAPTLVPDDLDPQQWYLMSAPYSSAYVATISNRFNLDRDIDAPEGWAVMEAVFDSSMTAAVGVVDSGCGVDGYYDPAVGYVPDHPDLANSVLFENTLEVHGDSLDNDLNGKADDSNGWDFSFEDSGPDDDSPIFHGTKISGIVGAQWGNNEGVAGVGKGQVTVLPLKASYSFDIVAAVYYAMDLADAGHPVRVMNMSFKTVNQWGMGEDWPELRVAVRDAGKGPYNIAVVAAAGNAAGDNDDFIDRFFPAEYTRDPTIDSVLAVASTGKLGALSGFSNYGPVSVQVAAPGEDIYTTAGPLPPDRYQADDGTSFATPIAGAVLGVVMAAHPDLTPAEAIERVVEGGDFDARLAGLIRSGKRVNLAGALAPFYPYSGLVYLDTPVAVNMYTDEISSMYGTVVSAPLDPAFSTSPHAAVMVSDGSGAWAVSGLRPGVAQFTLAFDGIDAPLGTYDTGPWRVTAIRPFSGKVLVGGTITFTPLVVGDEVSWSVNDTSVATIVTNGDGTGTLTARTDGVVRVLLAVDGQTIDNTGQILVVSSVNPPAGGGGGGCGTTLPPGDDPWTALPGLLLTVLLLLGLRRRFLAEANSISKI